MLREALRSLRRAPLFTLGAVAILAIALGAATAIFAVLDTVLLKPLPLRAPERIMQVWETHARHPGGHVEVAYGNFDQWRQRAREFEELALMTSVDIDVSLAGPEGATPAVAQYVTDGFFRVLGVAPALGRDFARGETDTTGAPTAIISHGLWQRRFGGATAVLGQRIEIDGEAATVVGVMPARFDYPRGVDLYYLVQSSPELKGEHKMRYWRVLGRLREGVERPEAAKSLDALALVLAKEFPELQGYGINIEPLLEEIFGSALRALPLLQAAGIFVALIGCLNVGHLLLVRATRRRGELATRLALGATPARVSRMLVGEGLIVGALATVLALLVAALALEWLRRTGPADLPRIAELALTPATYAFALLGALAAGALSGAFAARRLARGAIATRIAEAGVRGSAGVATARGRRAMIVSQLACTLVLLAGALVMLASVRALNGVDPGFRSEGMFSARVALVRAKYPDGPAQAAFFARLLEEARRIPGVESAAAVLMRPLSGAIGWDYRFEVEGQGAEEAKANPYSNFEAISEGYFSTMGLELVRGRDFTAEDDADAPRVAIVGEGVAARYWPGQDALGKRFKVLSSPDAPWLTVVGVARDAHYRQWGATRLDLYAPFRQMPEYRMDYMLRSPRAVPELADAFAATVARLDPGQAVSAVTSMDAQVASALARPRFHVALLSAFAVLAALLAAAGVFAVMLAVVEQRRIEFGVRRALGADGGAIARTVLGSALRDALIACAVGVALAVPALVALRALLFGVSPFDPGSLALAIASTLLAAVVASAVPAWRAARVAPAESLRNE